MLTVVNKKEKNMISKALEEYLKTMYILKKQNGNIRVTDIANKMEYTKPSVNKAINNLKEEKLVNYEAYGTIELTSEGENLAKKILEAYDIIYVFLKDVLNLDALIRFFKLCPIFSDKHFGVINKPPFARLSQCSGVNIYHTHLL